MDHIESNLKFSFSAEMWSKVIKFDDHTHQIRQQLEGTKGIDFLGFYKDEALVFIEVKNFEGHEIENDNPNKLKNGMDVLSTTIAQKIKDTIAILVGCSRNHNDSDWNEYSDHIIANKKLYIIAWIEADLNQLPLTQRERSRISTNNQRFKNKLSWLTQNYISFNCISNTPQFEGFSVSRNL